MDVTVVRNRKHVNERLKSQKYIISNSNSNSTYIQTDKSDVLSRDRSSSSGSSSGVDSGVDGVRACKPRKRSLSAHAKNRKRNSVRRNSAPENSSTFSDFLSGSRRIVTEAEDFVKHVIEAGWDLVHHHHLPGWLQDNEYLVFGHRLPLNSFKACFRSVFQIHTETGNIWTHLLGMIAFISIAAYTLSSRYIDWMWQDITVHSVFFGGAILCLTFSWLFHTVFCHSENVSKLFGKLDYCGITLLIVGSFVPSLYYAFFCHFVAHMVYLVSIIVLGTSCIIVSLFDKFGTPAYRPLRAGLFIGLGLTGVIPTIHLITIVGIYPAMYEYAVLHLLTMAFLYIGGALMYAYRIPESLYPGKFDIWFHSHQIFHVCVIAAALVHFRGLQIISHTRHNYTECAS
ncbi:adiponectin receptor protein-like [Mercenaria mercenaria]|uniref:adiponectin receptor protein-like n=1 Tax=Mercenaria mercenaria TaxID=6596 RepID=UPI00234F1316|nr:adiponectin receptor protein-like [Mercenaria mercenaria]